MKVMVYTFNNTDKWWRHVAANLVFATETVIVSDLPHADIDISPAFERYMGRAGIERAALATLGEDQVDDVVARCRLLRVLDRAEAIRMIGAMWQTIEDVLARERPDLFMCFVIDRYILDLFERALRRRGVPYVGLAIGILPNTIMFTSRGEHTPVREPPMDEVEDAVARLTSREFVPSYVPSQAFGLRRFLTLYAHLTARHFAFEGLRVLRQRPHDYVYLAARSPASGFRVRLKDWATMKYFRNDWQADLARSSPDKRVFVALSVNPEAAIEYWVRDLRLVDYETTIERIALAFGRAGFRLFVKDHPNQFGYRQVEVFQRLARTGSVSFVPYTVPAKWLIERCATTLTWTGTVGFQAALEGRTTIVADGAYYALDDAVIRMTSQNIDELPSAVSAFTHKTTVRDRQRALVRHLLRCTVPGDYMSWRRFNPADAGRVDRTALLIESLNRYVPALAGRSG